MIKITLFVLFSTLLLLFTLSRRFQHRFYRFFAFETLLVLIFLNASDWFENPFSIGQIASWVFLAGSLLLAWHGIWLLRTRGLPRGDLEVTTRLVTSGAYRFIRHPLYSSLLCLGVGVFLKRPSLVAVILLLLLSGFVYATAKVEEGENLARFGDWYRLYMNKTKMFIPFLISLPGFLPLP